MIHVTIPIESIFDQPGFSLLPQVPMSLDKITCALRIAAGNRNLQNLELRARVTLLIACNSHRFSMRAAENWVSDRIEIASDRLFGFYHRRLACTRTHMYAIIKDDCKSVRQLILQDGWYNSELVEYFEISGPNPEIAEDSMRFAGIDGIKPRNWI